MFSCAKQSSNDSIYETNNQEAISHIVGGIEAQESILNDNSFVMIVSESDEGRPQVCTGVIIAKNYILTAAHCVNDSISSLSINTGVKPLESDSRSLTPRSIIRHPKYNPSSASERHDLALIKIKEDIAMPAYSLALPDITMMRDFMNEPVTEFISVGYGVTDDLNSEKRSEGILRMVSQKTIYKDQNIFIVDQSVQKGVCYGDSGGPALAGYNGQYYIIGIASGVFDLKNKQNAGDDCTQAALFMNLVPEMPWIKSVILPMIQI